VPRDLARYIGKSKLYMDGRPGARGASPLVLARRSAWMIPIMMGHDWVEKLKNLRVDRAGGNAAPHKPLLLLVVCDLADECLLDERRLLLTPELASRFLSYWPIVAHRRPQAPDIRLPFHHLASDDVWLALDAADRVSHSRTETRSVEFAPGFRQFLANRESRQLARSALISSFFQPAEQLALCEALGCDCTETLALAQTLNDELVTAARQIGRESRFRARVLAAYDYTCALTHYRITTVTGTTIVDAAHIHQFADSRNNEFTNGIALCKNAHWLFDQGLWTIDAEYRVAVAFGHFDEVQDRSGFSLCAMQGEQIRIPRDKDLWPSQQYIDWHRKNCFLGP
jgi:putative restriction endonuclease